MSQTKREHFVPRWYLERFANPTTGNVCVFDKFTQKVFESSVWNIAQERHFYDLRPESIKEEFRKTGIDLQEIEKALAVIEGYFAQAIDHLLEYIERRTGIPPDLRWMLAVQMAIQWTRTRRYRNAMVELAEIRMQAETDEAVRRRFPDLAKDEYPTVKIAEHSIPAMHNQLFFNDEHWERLANVFVRHIWLIGVNNTPTPFYTSDHPVVRRANVPDQPCGGIGIDSPGVEFFLPVSPVYALILRERSYFREQWEKHDGGGLLLAPESVEAYNRMQVVQCHRHVFSSTGDFAIARSACVEDPTICDPNRKTVEMTVTQVDPMRTRFETRSLQ